MLAKLNPLAVFCQLPFALTRPGLFQPSRNVCPDWTRNRILLGSFRAGDLLEFSKLQGDGVEVDTVLFFFSLFLLGFLKWNAWKTWGRINLTSDLLKKLLLEWKKMYSTERTWIITQTPNAALFVRLSRKEENHLWTLLLLNLRILDFGGIEL